MQSNPFVGVIYHWIGGLAAGSFYLPFKRVRRWSWETYWLVAGVFSWILAPTFFALLLTRDVGKVLAETDGRTWAWGYAWGAIWGIGGLTYGLSVRYLGVSLGCAIALGLCTVLGMLMPPLFEGQFREILWDKPSGFTVLMGLVVCVIGIAITGLAGIGKEREMPAEEKKATVQEFSFGKGVTVATICGVLSAAFSYGLTATKAIKAISIHHGTDAIWAGLPQLIVILLGGFTTNAIWCGLLGARNRTFGEYASIAGPSLSREEEPVLETAIEMPGEEMAKALPPSSGRASMAVNYTLSALAGLTWYFQFFFYTMGSSQMGKYDFSSWTLHMASIIIFSTLWGLALREWRGSSVRTRTLIGVGLAMLVLSTVVVGYGNYLGSMEK
ncbi:MAG: rhaT [Phycisphaerales bacterium]|nr:rhaT [Phycisphaerales bacterium]